MAQKYTLASNPTANQAFLPFANSAAAGGICQLSDGTPVWVDNTQSSGNSRLMMSTDRASATVIAAGLPASLQWNSGSNTNVHVCRDASDNLFVVGTWSGNSNSVAVIPFVKGTGKTWAQGTAVTFFPYTSSAIVFASPARWANTGGGTGGKGHLVITAATSDYNQHTVTTLNAGALLAGQFQSFDAQTTIGPAASSGTGCTDLEQDGFGGTTFVTLVETTANNGSQQLASFSVSSSGAITIGSWMSGQLNMGLGTGQLPTLVRIAAGTWALIAQPLNTLGSTWRVFTFTVNGFIRSGDNVDSGDANAVNNVAWAVAKTPGAARVLIYSLSRTRNADIVVRRHEITPSQVTNAASTLYAAAVIDDTITGSGANYGSDQVGNSRIRATREQGGAVVDWQVTSQNQNNGSQFYSWGDTTTFNSPPSAATPTTPTTGSSVDRTTPITLAWVFNDPDAGDSQSKSDIRYKITSASTWTTILGATTTATSYALPANQAAGNYEWQVLTYDALGVASPWSSSSFFTAADPPGTPVITAPANGGTIATASYTVTWSSPQQDAYEVRRVADNAGSPNTGNVYFTTGAVEDATSRARTLTFDTNNRTEHVQVRVRYSGVWSQWATARVLVSYTPPATPVVVLTPQDATGSMLVAITNPTPSGSQPAVATHDILIDDGFGEGFTRRVTGWAPGATYTYWLPVSGRAYEGNIRVVAVATNGTTSTGVAT